MLKVHKLDTLNRVIFPNCVITRNGDRMNNRLNCKRFHAQNEYESQNEICAEGHKEDNENEQEKEKHT